MEATAGMECAMGSSAARSLMQIGDVAAATGIAVRNVRFYETAGLVVARGRTDAGYRLFDDEAVGRLRFIRRARSLGLGLEEIRTVLAVRDGGQPPCRHIQQLLGERIAQVDAQLESLVALRVELARLADELRNAMANSTSEVACPCFELILTA